jgi:hypothetical protein
MSCELALSRRNYPFSCRINRYGSSSALLGPGMCRVGVVCRVKVNVLDLNVGASLRFRQSRAWHSHHGPSPLSHASLRHDLDLDLSPPLGRHEHRRSPTPGAVTAHMPIVRLHTPAACLSPFFPHIIHYPDTRNSTAARTTAWRNSDNTYAALRINIAIARAGARNSDPRTNISK